MVETKEFSLNNSKPFLHRNWPVSSDCVILIPVSTFKTASGGFLLCILVFFFSLLGKKDEWQFNTWVTCDGKLVNNPLVISASGPGWLGFDQILWINKNMKRKFLGLLEYVQCWGKLKGKMMCIKSVLLKGLWRCFRGYILSGHLSEEGEALALTLDPGKAASIAARHSHATRGEWGLCQEAG